MQDQLIDFFASPLRTKWLETTQMKAYVRKGKHLGTDGKLHLYLDIASVEVQEQFWHQGLFKSFLALCQKVQPYDGIKIENVLNPNLCAYLRKLAITDLRWTELETFKDVESDFLWEPFLLNNREQ